MDEEVRNDFVTYGASNLYCAWHTDPSQFYDKKNKITHFLEGALPRRLMVIDGPAPNAVKGVIRASRAMRFEPQHTTESTASNDPCDYDALLVGANGQFLRSAVTSDGQRESLEGDIESLELPTGTWIDILPQTVHSAPNHVANGRCAVFVNPQEFTTRDVMSNELYTAPGVPIGKML